MRIGVLERGNSDRRLGVSVCILKQRHYFEVRKGEIPEGMLDDLSYQAHLKIALIMPDYFFLSKTRRTVSATSRFTTGFMTNSLIPTDLAFSGDTVSL